jgi:hypothetical protein
LANAAGQAKFPAEREIMRATLAIVGLIAAGIGTPVSGAEKPRTTALKLAASVNLENKRPVSLLDFEIIMPGKDKTPETIVGRLDKPLGAGAAASFPLSGGHGCVFEARWAFEDVKDSGEIDLCNEGHIVLVD